MTEKTNARTSIRLAKLAVALLMTVAALTDTGCSMPGCGGKKGKGQQQAKVPPTAKPITATAPAPAPVDPGLAAIPADPDGQFTTAATVSAGGHSFGSFTDPDPSQQPLFYSEVPTLAPIIATPEAGMTLDRTLAPAGQPIDYNALDAMLNANRPAMTVPGLR